MALKKDTYPINGDGKGFIDLPDNVICLIVYFATDGSVNLHSNDPIISTQERELRPPFTLELNHHIPHFSTLLALSSTCVYLRKFLGRVLFQNMSLVRENHVDSILKLPKSSEMFSFKDQYYREVIREILFKGFEECSCSELAQTGFKMVKGSDFASRYQSSFSMNNFVTYLECGKELITSGNLRLFKNLRGLKVLDNFTGTVERDLGLRCLSSLAINVINVHIFSPIFTQLDRLDLYIDYNECTPEDLRALSSSVDQCGLKEVNIFISDKPLLYVAQVQQFIAKICTSSLRQLTLRKIRRSAKQGRTEVGFETSTDIGATFTCVLTKCPNLEHFTIDVQFLKLFTVDTDAQPASMSPVNLHSPGRILTIVDSLLYVPRMSLDFRETVEMVIRKLGITHLSLQFGDPMSQLDVSARSQLTDFAEFFHSRNKGVALNLSRAQVWSTSNETVQREWILGSASKTVSKDPNTSRESNRKEKQRIDTLKPWTKLPMTKPTFLRYDEWQVLPQQEFKITNVLHFDPTVQTRFWSSEASLMELEQYAKRNSRRTLIWD